MCTYRCTCKHVTFTDAPNMQAHRGTYPYHTHIMKNGEKIKKGEQAVFTGREQALGWL